ncbi:MAG: ABC transporter substrate-binding protein, partial [Candidatus Tectomicrobia bacterium]|nr:ABC transporter substrate-binding protein [Candidatus Tectomicrobia bacterium]
MKSRLLSGVVFGLWVTTMAGWVVALPVARGAETVKVHVFPGTANLPLMVAEEKGVFAKNNIKLQLSFTRSSKEQMTGIRDGKWDLGSTSPDNVIAYNVNDGTDFFLFMGVGGTTIRFVVDPAIKSFNDL